MAVRDSRACYCSMQNVTLGSRMSHDNTGHPLTWNLGLGQRDGLQQKDGDPAQSVGENNEEEPLGDGDLAGKDAAFRRLGAGVVDGIEHAAVGEDDGDKCQQVQTWQREAQGDTSAGQL
ncbi:hypothetical protein FKM82_002628 [Ascaphus truei]